MIELLPTKASFAPDEPVEVEARGGRAALELWRLDRKVGEAVADPIASFGVVPEGGYGVEGGGATTALDVLARPFERLRYGFVSRYDVGRSPDGVADNVRRLHLNAVQFYDWMYRHAGLLPPDDEFEDALGQRISLETVRSLAAAVRGAGAAPMGYAAVYAAGAEHRQAWDLLHHADGAPWQLADFLWITDPTSERWLQHLARQLRAAQDAVGFAGFHLDQYGAPKRAQRADGTVVDLADAFPRLIEHIRRALPDAALIFNNVNDFPTWSTAAAPQDAVYIEVWPPHDRLDDLGRLIEKARSLAPEKPVALAAYLSSYDGHSAAMQLELATIFSHGGTCLLHGEEDAILTDPYYVRHQRMDAGSVAAARAYYDFAVRYGDLLFDRRLVDVTESLTGGINEDVRVDAPDVWPRIRAGNGRIVVSLIAARPETPWDAPARLSGVAGAVISLQRAGPSPAFFFATPEAPAARALESEFDGRYDTLRLPDFDAWALVWARLP